MSAERLSGEDMNAPSDELLNFFTGLSSDLEEAQEHTEEVPAEEPVEEEQPEEPTEEVDESESTEENTPVDWEKRYKDLQSYSDKRYNDLQQQIAAQQEYLQQQAQSQQQEQEAQIYNVTAAQLDNGIQSDAVTTMQWVLQNRPDLTGHAVEMIRNHHGDELASQAQIAAQQYMFQQQQQLLANQHAAFEQQQQAMAAPSIIKNGLETIINDLSGTYGEDFQRLSGRTLELVKENASYLTDAGPEGVRNFVERNYLLALREDMTSVAKADASKPKPVNAQDFVEDGTPGQRPEVTSDDEFVQELVDAWKQTSYR